MCAPLFFGLETKDVTEPIASANQEPGNQQSDCNDKSMTAEEQLEDMEEDEEEEVYETETDETETTEIESDEDDSKKSNR